MKNRLVVYLFYLVLVSFAATGVSFACFETAISGSDEANVAQAVIKYVPLTATLNGAEITGIDNGLSISEVKPGDLLVYTFNVTNFKDANINQVLLKYKIDVYFNPSTKELPLTYTLYPSDTYSSAGGGWTYMNYGAQETHNYTLTVSWDAAEDGGEYIGKEQSIQILIEAEQVDST